MVARPMSKLAFLFTLLTSFVLRAQPPAAIQKYLTQPGFTWECARQSTFQFCWESTLAGDVNMAAARNSAEASRNQVLRRAHIAKYESVVYVFFLASPDRMEKLIGYHGEGRSRPAQHAIFFVPTPIRPDLTHELCHEILSNVWGSAEAWIEEGFATLAAEPQVVHETCLAMTVRQGMIPLKQLVRPEWNPSLYSPDVTYVELGGFVEFLQRVYGLDRTRQIWQRGSASISSVLGKPLATLENEWRLQLQTEISATK